jgi:hypothetical protein
LDGIAKLSLPVIVIRDVVAATSGKGKLAGAQ